MAEMRIITKPEEDFEDTDIRTSDSSIRVRKSIAVEVSRSLENRRIGELNRYFLDDDSIDIDTS